MDNYAFSLLKSMLEIHSPSGQEDELSSFLLGEMRRLGFHSRRDDVGNVIAESGQGSPAILLCGHMDTVPGKLENVFEERKMRARGAVDAKPSLAAMMIGASKVRNEFPGRILLLGVVDEEDHGTGMKHFIQTNPLNVDYAVIGEPSNTENIVVGYKGFVRLALKCTTKAGHSAAPWLSENAVEKGMEIWSKIKDWLADSGQRTSRFHSVTGTLTGISGGSTFNVVPAECTLTLDLRIPPGLNPAQVLNNVRKTIGSCLDDNTSTSVNLEVVDQVEACMMNIDSKVARAFSWAIRRVRKKNPTYLKKTGTSDMNVLASKVKIPMVAYGPGDSKLDHTTEEEIVIEDYLAAIEIYEQALRRLADLDKGKDQRVLN